MDPFGIVALVVAGGWLIGKLNDDNKPKPPPPSGRAPPSPTSSPGARGVYHPVAPDRVHRPAKQAQAEDAIEVLPEYKLVRDLVRAGFPITFVTGGAGTGKSTFVHWLTSQFNGTVLLTAPTGIAALNINGKTLHSLCKLPPAWITKRDIRYAGRDIVQHPERGCQCR